MSGNDDSREGGAVASRGEDRLLDERNGPVGGASDNLSDSLSDSLKEVLQAYIAHHDETGERLSPQELCGGDERLLRALEIHLAEYEQLRSALELPNVGPGGSRLLTEGVADVPRASEELPSFDGFRTVERLGGGGGGEVYRLLDLELGRTVAAKVVAESRPGSLGRDRLAEFLEEARALALFDDERIVRLLELRTDSARTLLLMEYVEGFTLDRLAPSLDHRQRARILLEVAEAVEHAHSCGVRHNDLKPANILLDHRLRPKILDFGLSDGRWAGLGLGAPSQGGTLPYAAPERLAADQSSDHRADVFALGVVLYELLCGDRPFDGETEEELRANLLVCRPRLPIEIEPAVPEPLQAITLKALERDPKQRYRSAGEMARDLERYLSGRPVAARPTLYRSALEHRLRSHLRDLREWLDSKLIYPHEAERLRLQYRRLEGRDEDWIVASRLLTPSRIALYLGGFVAAFGAMLFLLIRSRAEAVGVGQPVLILGLPFVALHVAGGWHERRDLPRISVACTMASFGLLLPLLLIVLDELGLLAATPGGEPALLGDLGYSDPQLLLASFVAGAWAVRQALRTRTIGLSALAAGLWIVFSIAALSDIGLRRWFEEGELDRVALGLLPVATVTWLFGMLSERVRRPWFALPLYWTSSLLAVSALELLAQNGKLFHRLGLSLSALQSTEVSDPQLLDTIAAMVLNGVGVYLLAAVIERASSELMVRAARLLFVLTPFLVLKPLLYLSMTGEYSVRFDWLLLVLGVAVAFFSRVRQRKSFYYAGLFSVGAALWQLTSHEEWWETPSWAGWVIVGGLSVLGLGVGLDWREQRRQVESSGGGEEHLA